MNFMLANGSIRLQCSGVTEEHRRWFIDVFQKAWARIPQVDRHFIAEYWRSRSAPPTCADPDHPTYEYDTKILLTNASALPRVWYEGHRVNMSALVLKELGDQFAEEAVLHELAHVFWYASCEPHHWIDRAADRGAKRVADETAERLVTAKLLEWGINQSELLARRDRWEREHPSRD
jgi:hypothetical protein